MATTAHLSHCCGATVHHDAWGHVLCSRCWHSTVPRPDLIGWLFPAQHGPRPNGEAVFVRYGKRIELLQPGAVRGRPDSWSWSGA